MTRTHKKRTFSLESMMESRDMDHATWIMTGIPVNNDNWSFHVNLELKRQRDGEQVHRRACLHQMDRECLAWAAASYHTSTHKQPAGDATTGTVLGKRAGILSQHCAGISCVIPVGATQMWLLCCTMCSDHRLKVNRGRQSGTQNNAARHSTNAGPMSESLAQNLNTVGLRERYVRARLCAW